jgi:urease accessory protein
MTAARLLQLASPALPIGGYSYSTALEWGIESGEVKDAATALAWIDDALSLTLAAFEAPLMVAALRQARRATTGSAAASPASPVAPVPTIAAVAASPADRLVDLNALAIASRETVELRLESEQMGYSLGQWLDAAFEAPGPDAALRSRLKPLSLPVAWALAAMRLDLGERDAAVGLLWAFAENQVMVMMKALPMGQMAAQRLLLALGPRVEAAADRALALDEHEWSSSAPALAIASMRHETQYSRLFRS